MLREALRFYFRALWFALYLHLKSRGGGECGQGKQEQANAGEREQDFHFPV